nr:prepilin peptidase [Rubellimicrobium aerolatum]
MPLVLPVAAWAAWSDLARMTIPNRAVLALIAVFAAGGLLLTALGAWSLADWAGRAAHLPVVLLVGLALHAAGQAGAGDAKLAAVAAPFVAAGDLGAVLRLLLTVLLVAWALHRLARRTVGPRLAPGWASWAPGPRFPMGIVLSATLVAYLALAALG